MKIFRFTVAFAFLVLFIPVFIQAQSKERIINVYHWRNEPLKILSIKIKDREIKTDEKFFGEDDDWFSDLSVEVENVSGQKIENIIIALRAPIEIGMQYGATHQLKYGAFFRYNSRKKIVNKSEPSLKPGEKATIKLKDYQAAHSLFNAVGYGKSLSELRIDISSVLFADEKMWNQGIIFIRDPNDLNSWVNEKYLKSSTK